MVNSPIIAIDGPAASGKGTLSKAIAKALNYAHMDTGALYRAVGFEVLQNGGTPEDPMQAIKAAQTLMDKIAKASSPKEILGNPILREDKTASAASKVAAIQEVRDILINLQHNFAQSPGNAYEGAVLDGRDIGTVVFPKADVKLFVTATTEIRAQRRLKELQSKGIPVTSEAVLKDMRERDQRDARRSVAPLKPASDAFILDTSKLGPDEMLEQALAAIREKLST